VPQFPVPQAIPRVSSDLTNLTAQLKVVSEIPKTASEKPQERFLLEQFDENASTIITEG
jgi:hypothetical protein